MTAKLKAIHTRRKLRINIKNAISTKRVVKVKLVMIARHPATIIKVLTGIKKVMIIV